MPSNTIRTDDMTNANTRPRSWSDTSCPIMVNPLIQAIPAKTPITEAASTAPRKSCRTAITISEMPAAPMAGVKIIRRGTVGSTLGPINMPSARPVNTAPNRMPYPALPAPSVATYACATPATSPPAPNAPRMPM